MPCSEHSEMSASMFIVRKIQNVKQWPCQSNIPWHMLMATQRLGSSRFLVCQRRIIFSDVSTFWSTTGNVIISETTRTVVVSQYLLDILGERRIGLTVSIYYSLQWQSLIQVRMYRILEEWSIHTTVSDYISRSILLFPLLFWFCKINSFSLSSPFFESTTPGRSTPFIGFYKKVFTRPCTNTGYTSKLYKPVICISCPVPMR